VKIEWSILADTSLANRQILWSIASAIFNELEIREISVNLVGRSETRGGGLWVARIASSMFNVPRVPHDADWRWLLNRRDSPWYPTMRLFRQPTEGRWDLVLDEVNLALGEAEAKAPVEINEPKKC